MLEALIAGQRDPAVLADLAKRRAAVQDPCPDRRARRPLRADHHAFLARMHLDLIDHLTETIDLLTGGSRRRWPRFAPPGTS